MTGFTTFSSLPHFPYIGGAFPVANSRDQCGTCWQLTNPKTGASITVLAIDSAGENTFNVGQQALDELTNGHAVEYGSAPVNYQEVDASECGF